MVYATKTVGEAMPVYDAVVIGSGYGGGVAASRLARMGLRLAVLEQGRLWRPGDFPITGKARLKTPRLTGRAKLGDVVRIIECRPLSKLKRWRLGEIVRKAALVAVAPKDLDVKI